MSDDQLKRAAEALVTRTVEHGDPFNGGDCDTVQVARWALRLAAERDELRAAIYSAGYAVQKMGGEPTTLIPVKHTTSLLAGKVVPPC